MGIGYATSTDGRYWVRSPSNSPLPPIAGPAGAWEQTVTAFLAGGLIVDPAAPDGIILYYSTIRVVDVLGTQHCVPNGIGRASRM
jgi:hypothetical protein